MTDNELPSAIMNLPCTGSTAGSDTDYEEGFRDARHAAAELVSAHLAAHPGRQGGWQPIDSAPKEEACAGNGLHYGPRILAWCPDQQDAVRCRWWWSDSGASNFIADGGWACFPTRWQPLPKEPTHD